MKDRLVFDTTDVDTIEASDSVGAWVRSGDDGTLITYHTLIDDEKAKLITQGLVIKSKLAGTVGNAYSFEVIDSGAGPIIFSEPGGAVQVNLQGNAATVAQIVTLLSGSAFVDVSAGTPNGSVVVAAAQNLSGGKNSSLHQHLDVFAPLHDAEGNPISSSNGALNVNVTNSLAIDIDGVYNVGTNSNPDNAGIIAHTRSATPGDAEQVERTTAGTANADNISPANVHGLDVNSFGMIYDTVGANWDRMTGTGGNLNINIAASSGTVTVTDAALANVAIANDVNVLNVADTAEAAVASALANRKYLWIYNNDNTRVFIGSATVTASNGFPVSPGSYLELRAGASVSPFFVGQTGKTPEIRTLELS